MNPADVPLVREGMPHEPDAPRLTLVADASVAPGGCHADTAQASLDATLAKRWQRLLASLGRTDDWLERR